MERHGKRGGKERGEGIERQEQVHLQFDEADKKETGGGGGESFDGNPFRLFLPSLSSGYIKHI